MSYSVALGSISAEAVWAVAYGAPVSWTDAGRAALEPARSAFAGRPVLAEKYRFVVGTEPGPDLIRSFILGHNAGVGDPLPIWGVRALMFCRANVLAQGHSGVRPAVVDAILDLLNRGYTPIIPSQGSVGAAGDLAPLAHLARVICGLGGIVEGPDGQRVRDIPGFQPIDPTEKEALALINGATLTVALGAIAVVQAERVIDALLTATALSMEALAADRRCLSVEGIAARHHPGGVRVAEHLRWLLEGSALVQVKVAADPFSLRAAPAVIGTAMEALEHVRAIVQAELNGACDNPIWTPTDGIVETGNFHGAPVAAALDYLRIALTQAATQSERRTYRLCTGHLTGDLPSFLVEGTGLNSGFMLAQYTAASLASECKGLCHPAVVDSIPTVQHNEDHVSMGPIAARLTLRVIECVMDIVAIEAIFGAQALDFRMAGVSFPEGRRTQGTPVQLAPRLAEAHTRVRSVVEHWGDDQVMHPTLVAAGKLVRAGRLGMLADSRTSPPR